METESLMEEQEFMSTGEVSIMTTVPVPTLRWWRHNGTGPKSFKLGARKVVYRRSDVVAWLEEQYAAADLGNAG